MHVMRLESHRNLRILVAHENITPYRRAECALRRSEERLSAILECAAEGIVVITADGVIETFNKAAETIFGYAAAEILGRDVSLLLPDPYDRMHNGFVSNYLKTGQSSIIGAGREVIGRRKDGSQFPMYIAVSEVRNEAQHLFTAIIHDVTGHKGIRCWRSRFWRPALRSSAASAKIFTTASARS
jgi:PAS domain S-box-containing protein